MADVMKTRAIGGDGPARDVDAELDRLIARRAGVVSPANAREALWAASERRHEAAKRERHRWEWIRFFDRMSRSHAALAADYAERAERLCQEGAQA